jgi:hypothetical protein
MGIGMSQDLQLHSSAPEDDKRVSQVGFEIMIPVLSNAASNRDAPVTKSSFSYTLFSNEHSFQVTTDDSVGARKHKHFSYKCFL